MRGNHEKNYCIIFAFAFSVVMGLIVLCMLPSLLS